MENVITQNTESSTENSVVDPHKLDHLMSLSSELMIIRSRYARTEKLLRHDLSRQKEVVQGAVIEADPGDMQDPMESIVWSKSTHIDVLWDKILGLWACGHWGQK